MNLRQSVGDIHGLAARAPLWLHVLALAVGVLLFAFSPEAVERRLLAACALMLLAAATLLVRVIPALREPRSRQQVVDISASLIGVTLLAAATGAAGSAVLPLYLIPLASSALSFGRWWLVLLLSGLVAALVFGLGAMTPDVNVGSPEFGVQLLGALAPGAAVAMILAGLMEQIRAAGQRISTLTSTDTLTGLLNLRAFEQTLQQVHRRSERYGRPYALLVVDVDNLAQVNETLGHEAGGEVLGAVAAAVARSIRRTDVAARLGGDELVVLLTESDRPTAEAIAQRIRNHVYAGTVSVGHRLVRANVSVGAAVYPEDHLHPKELMIMADRRMQQDRELRRPPAA
ncbi:MAG TPA: GGDEF domain-containing protein [Steroidobacter sp.]|nr:GGDEF domain-containing protein [Steroidobacter sp.]